MGRFGSVLYVERRSCDRAFSCALQLAARQGSRLTLARLEEDTRLGGAGNEAGAAELRARGRERCRERLHRLSGLAEEAGVRRPGTVLLEGPATAAVCEEARRGRHDLVVTASESPAGLPRPWPLDTPDRRLLRSCPSPVWLLDPGRGDDPRVVLAAVDVAPGRSVALGGRIVRVAATLAAGAGAELHVVHAWSVVGEPIMTSPLEGVSGPRLRSVRTGVRDDRRSRLDRLVVREGGGAKGSAILRKGDPYRVVRAVAAAVQADVVVVGCSGRTGLSRLLWWSMGERLVGAVGSSVLVVKEPRADGAHGGGARPAASRSRARAL